MPLHADVKAVLESSLQVDVSFLFQIEIPLGTSTLYYRYCVDNFPKSTDSGAKVWLPWPLDITDFITRLKASQSPTKVTFYDPDDTNMPGSLKTLIQDKKIYNRAKFSMWLVLGDPSPNITQVADSFVSNVLAFPAVSPHGLTIGDLVEVDDGSGTFYRFEVISISGDNVGVSPRYVGSVTFSDPTPTVRKPLYKDDSTWYVLFKGKMKSSETVEHVVALDIQPESDLLNFPIPRVTFSFPCPYVTGDANCTRNSSNIAYVADFSIVSASGNTLVVQTPTNIEPSGASIPISGATDDALWNLGIAIFQTGDLAGTIRNVVACTYASSQYTLTLDENITGSYSSGTVQLRANCNRSYDDCKARFNNAINFGGTQTMVRAAGGINAPRQLSAR